MELKPGYKQAEVGAIPEDWECRPLKHLIAAGTSITYGIVQAGPHVGNGVPYIRTGDMSRDVLRCQELARTSRTIASRYPRSAVRGGDLVYSIRATVGLVHTVPSELDGANLTQGTARIAPGVSIDGGFLLQTLRSRASQDWVDKHTKGSTYKEITLATLRLVPVPVPPPAEQRAIAAALADVDALLGALEKLIAKKRDLKQAAMQQLLTGKTRLRGFASGHGFKRAHIGSVPEDWDVKPLTTISSMNGRIGWQGLKQEEFTENPDDPFLITGMNFKDGRIRWGEVYHIPTRRYEEAKGIQLRPDDVLMTKDGTIGKVLYVDAIPHPGEASLNSHLLVFRPLNREYVPKFLFYQLQSRAFAEYVELNKSGSTFFGLTQQATGNYEAVLPSVPEQTAIATVLSDMDAEIAGLEVRLAKTRALKQGMMQELLTGRIRLV